MSKAPGNPHGIFRQAFDEAIEGENEDVDELLYFLTEEELSELLEVARCLEQRTALKIETGEHTNLKEVST